MKKDYAGAAKIDEFQVFAADGVELPSDVYSKMILAVTKMPGVRDQRWTDTGTWQIDDDTYHIYAAEQQMNPLALSLRSMTLRRQPDRTSLLTTAWSMCSMHLV